MRDAPESVDITNCVGVNENTMRRYSLAQAALQNLKVLETPPPRQIIISSKTAAGHDVCSSLMTHKSLLEHYFEISTTAYFELLIKAVTKLVYIYN